MNFSLKKLNSLLCSFVKIGLIGFGGGNALVPVMRREFVEKKKAISEERYLDMVFAANITPGALPVEIACGIGREMCGPCGMILAPVAITLPGAFLTLLLLIGYNSLGATLSSYVQLLSIPVSFYIIYQLAQYITETLVDAYHADKIRVDGFAFVLTAILVCGDDVCSFWNVEAPWLLSFSSTEIMIFVLVASFIITKPAKHPNFNYKKCIYNCSVWAICLGCLVLPAVLLCEKGLQTIAYGALSTLISFGGGDAYLKIAQDLFVDNHLLSTFLFFSILVPIVNILPGSILCKILTGVGYIIGVGASDGSKLIGLLLAVACCFTGIFFSSCCYLLIEDLYVSSRDFPVFVFIKDIVRPIVSAFMLSVILTLVNKDISILASFLPNG